MFDLGHALPMSPRNEPGLGMCNDQLYHMATLQQGQAIQQAHFMHGPCGARTHPTLRHIFVAVMISRKFAILDHRSERGKTKAPKLRIEGLIDQAAGNIR